MAIQNLPEFAKNGQKNTDGLVLLDGFPVNKKPARQWFNFLFNQLTMAINAINAEKLDATSNAVSASKLATPRSIGLSGGVTGTATNFDGTGNIIIPVTSVDATKLNGTASINTTGNAETATKLATPRTIGGVNFDGSANINLPGVNTTGNQNTTGSAAKLTTARTITLAGSITASASFDGSANITLTAAPKTVAYSSTLATAFRTQTKGDATNGPYISVGRSETAIENVAAVYGASLAVGTGDTHGYINFNHSTKQVIVGGGNADALNWTGQLAFTDSNITGNAATATKLQTARKINFAGAVTGSVSFDGSTDVTCNLSNPDLDILPYLPQPYPKTIPPSGYLSLAGQAITQAQYPKLYGLYGATLPDMRGEFIRGFDNGRGVDLGRSILSWQGDDLRSHTHSYFQVSGGGGGQTSGGGSSYNREVSTSNTGGTETRPRNISFNYIVKAG